MKNVLFIEDKKEYFDDSEFEVEFKKHGYSAELYDRELCTEKKLNFIDIINSISTSAPDCIVVDLQLTTDGSCDNGLRLIRHLKQNRTTENIPIIVLSAYVDKSLKGEQNREDALKTGANHAFGKREIQNAGELVVNVKQLLDKDN